MRFKVAEVNCVAFFVSQMHIARSANSANADGRGRAYWFFKERIRRGETEPNSEHLTRILVSSNHIVRGIGGALL
jgi:hypothetical protein